jgi:hypothetical protein
MIRAPSWTDFGEDLLAQVCHDIRVHCEEVEDERHSGGYCVAPGLYVGLGALEEPAIVSEEGLFKQELTKKVHCCFIMEGLPVFLHARFSESRFFM